MAAPAPDALEAALDQLYGVDPSEFVAERKRLAGELRAAGDKAAAKELAAARRPTTAAWALNELVRRDAEVIESFLDRSADLQAAQVGALSGGREGMRDATRAQREALAAAVDGAMTVLGDRATDAFRSQVLATLQAASADADVAEQLRAGRMIRELLGSTGFPDVPGLTLVPDLEPPAAKPSLRTAPAAKASGAKSVTAEKAGPREQAKAREREERDEAAAHVARAERERVERERAAAEVAARELAEAEAAALTAQADADTAESEAGGAHERLARLEADLDAARRAVRTADAAANAARREATRLARAAMKLRSRVDPRA